MNSFFSLLTAALPAAHAAMPPVPCVPALPGCNAIAGNAINESLLPNLALFFLRFGTGLSLVCIIVAGFMMMTSLGDEGSLTKQKWAVANALIGLLITIFSQALVSMVASYSFQIGNGTDLAVSGGLRYVVDIALTLMDSVFVVVMIVLGIQMVIAQGKSDAFNRAKTGVMWCIIGAIVVNVSAALVKGVLSIFNL